jgi:hypothetical protein
MDGVAGVAGLDLDWFLAATGELLAIPPPTGLTSGTGPWSTPAVPGKPKIQPSM